ncbi:MAG: T9SS type A sorting domain-containing protein, partial [Saprospiraceae bacterium]
FVLTATSGTGDPKAALFAEIFPNPARDKATLAVALPTAQTLYLSLTDATGRALQAWTVHQVTEQNIPLDLRTLPAGAYQLRILSGSGEQATKGVVVER